MPHLSSSVLVQNHLCQRYKTHPYLISVDSAMPFSRRIQTAKLSDDVVMSFRPLTSQTDSTSQSSQRSSSIRTKVTEELTNRKWSHDVSQTFNAAGWYSVDNIVQLLYWLKEYSSTFSDTVKSYLTLNIRSYLVLSSNSILFLFVDSAREAELRRLRKANIEFEEQNAVLQRHIKDMYNAKERLEAELGLDEKRTQALHQHLLAIKHTLVNSLSTVPLPG